MGGPERQQWGGGSRYVKSHTLSSRDRCQYRSLLGVPYCLKIKTASPRNRTQSKRSTGTTTAAMLIPPLASSTSMITTSLSSSSTSLSSGCLAVLQPIQSCRTDLGKPDSVFNCWLLNFQYLLPL